MKKTHPSTAILVALAAPALIVMAVMWRGYVLSVLWGWFVAPAFGLPALSVPVAIGLSMIVSMLTNHRNGKEAEKEVSHATALAVSMSMSFAGPALVLLFGWIAQKFI